MSALLEARNLTKVFPGRLGTAPIHAVKGVSLEVKAGEILGIVGESGSGKSTVSRMLVGIEQATSGDVVFQGEAITRDAEWQQLRRSVQYVFQDPFGSLAPHMKVRDIVRDPLDVHSIGTKSEREARVEQVLQQVGLRPTDLDQYPAVFSGGQRQRISLARSLVSNPQVLICDEVVSALDVSIQAQILNLLLDTHRALDLSMIFVSHDLRVIRYLCDRVAVMRSGEIVETGTVDQVFDEPQHEYTKALLSAVPSPPQLIGVS